MTTTPGGFKAAVQTEGRLSGRPPSSRRFPRAGLASGLAVILIAGAAAASIALDGVSHRTPLAAGPAAAGLAATNRTWPEFPGCDGSTSAAMARYTGTISGLRGSGDVRSQIVASGGGAWDEGHLTLTLSNQGKGILNIRNIHPHVNEGDLPPSQIFTPSEVCPGPQQAAEVTLDFNLDTSSLRNPTGATPVNPLGLLPDLAPGRSLTLTVDTVGCDNNYDWTLLISYVVAGDPQIRQLSLGPFLNFGLAHATQVFRGDPSSPANSARFTNATITGRDARCESS